MIFQPFIITWTKMIYFTWKNFCDCVQALILAIVEKIQNIYFFFVSYIKLPIFTIYIKLFSQFIYLLKENIKRKLSHTTGIQFLNKYILLELSLILLVKLFLENIELSIVSFQVYHYSRGNLRNLKKFSQQTFSSYTWKAILWSKILKEKWNFFKYI